MDIIRHDNGDISFKRRGQPPMVVPGFEPDLGDPYLFHPILPPCKRRGLITLPPCNNCPKGKTVPHCSKYNYIGVIVEQCIDCGNKDLNEP